MSFGPSFSSHSLDAVGLRLPWQFRVRPALSATFGSLIVVTLLAGGLVLLRRLTGGLNAELLPEAMLPLALGTLASLSLARIAWRRSFPLESPAELSATDKALGYASSAALALLAVGCCYPANRTADWLIWLPILVADQIWRQNFFDAGEPWVPSVDDVGEGLPAVSRHRASSSNTSNLVRQEILQQLYRVQSDCGADVIYGTLRADFEAGQRTAVVHAGFCPPLASLPEIEAEALPGSSAKIKVVQALAHGTRIEVKLPVAATRDTQIWIDMAARPQRDKDSRCEAEAIAV